MKTQSGDDDAPTPMTSSTATQIAMPSTHSPSARCWGMAAPSTVETRAAAHRSRMIGSWRFSQHSTKKFLVGFSLNVLAP